MLPADNEVITALKSSDQIMFERLFRHYYKSLCNYAMGIVGDYDEAEDVVQQTMIKVWGKRESLEITVSLKSYLYRAVHNSAINSIRQSKVRALYPAVQDGETGDRAEPASHKITTSELEREILSAINKLPDQCRMVFKLSRFEQMKYTEIAKQLGISVKTVENHMGKALKLMRENLKEYLVSILLFMPGFI